MVSSRCFFLEISGKKSIQSATFHSHVFLGGGRINNETIVFFACLAIENLLSWNADKPVD